MFIYISIHIGIKLKLGTLYNTEDHDLHHSKFSLNYGFPAPILDILHGTYHGRFLGLDIRHPLVTGELRGKGGGS